MKKGHVIGMKTIKYEYNPSDLGNITTNAVWNEKYKMKILSR